MGKNNSQKDREEAMKQADMAGELAAEQRKEEEAASEEPVQPEDEQEKVRESADSVQDSQGEEVQVPPADQDLGAGDNDSSGAGDGTYPYPRSVTERMEEISSLIHQGSNDVAAVKVATLAAAMGFSGFEEALESGNVGFSHGGPALSEEDGRYVVGLDAALEAVRNELQPKVAKD